MGAEFKRRDTVEDSGEGFGLGRVRSESPTQMEEGQEGTGGEMVGGERMERGREDSQATLREGPRGKNSTGSSNLGNGRPSEGRAEELVRDRNVSIASSTTTNSTKSKKGFFSRFKKSKPPTSSPTSPTGTSPTILSSSSPTASGSGIKRSGSVVSRATTNTLESRGPLTPGLSEINEPHLTTSSSGPGKQDKIRHPKVRTKGKSKKDFNHLFLAQELHLPSSSTLPNPTSATTPSRSHPNLNDTDSLHSLHTLDSSHSLHHSPQELDGIDEPPTTTTSPDKKGKSKGSGTSGGGGGEEKGSKKKSRAVWAVKFSNNGKWLAVGGRDGVVRSEYSLFLFLSSLDKERS